MTYNVFGGTLNLAQTTLLVSNGINAPAVETYLLAVWRRGLFVFLCDLKHVGYGN